MNKEWWCEQYDAICFELYGCEPHELTISQRIEFNLRANEIIANRAADIGDRLKDELDERR